MKKKGFTLIELLAVIVILAILALIAIPIIMNMINKARRAAAIDTAYGYVDSVEYSMNLSDINAAGYENINIKDQEYEVDDPDLENIKIKGKKPDSGVFTIEKRKIQSGSFCIDEFKVDYDGRKAYIVNSNECKGGSGGSQEETEVVIPDKVPCELETETVNNKEVYYIDSVEDMYAFSASVNGGNDYSGKTIILRNNLDFNDYTPEKKTKVCDNSDNENGFTPIGTESKPFKGIFEGNAKIISNLTVNRPNQDFIGLFGYIQNSEVYGVTLINPTMVGKTYVGTLSGWVNSSKVDEIIVENIDVKGNNYVGGVTAGINGVSSDKKDTKNLIVRGGKVESATYPVAGAVSTNDFNSIVSRIVIEGVNVKAANNAENSGIITVDGGWGRHSNGFYSNTSVLNNNTLTGGFDPKNYDDINFYEACGLDTWIGGDNDESGYIFDYNSSGKVVIKTVKDSKLPTNIDNTLSKDSNGKYLIKSESDWKKATVFVKDNKKFKLTKNLNFANKKFYMMGSDFNVFKGTFEGGAKTISNVTINADKASLLGIFGEISNSTIYGLNIDNIKINATKQIGGITGYMETSDVHEIVVLNEELKGHEYVGGIAGDENSSTACTINNILVKDAKVLSDTYPAGGIVAHSWDLNKMKNNNFVIEKMTLTGSNSQDTGIIAPSGGWSTYTKGYYSELTTMNGSSVSGSFTKESINDINFYEACGLDTWIGGDKDGSGYYFDYDDNGNVILVSIADKPLPTDIDIALDKEGDYYLIKNTSDWKKATVFVNDNKKFKMTNDLSFANDKFYMMGSDYNQFNGTFDGGANTISDILINASVSNYIGIFGLINKATIFGINLDNIKINAYEEIAALVGYSYDESNIFEITIDNVQIKGHDYVGGLVGNQIISNTSSGKNYVNNIIFKEGKVLGDTYPSGGIIAHSWDLSRSVNKYLIVEKVTLTGSNTMDTGIIAPDGGWSTYDHNTGVFSELSTRNGNSLGGFAQSNINNLTYYGSIGLETPQTGDSNGTGYIFNYDNAKGGVYLVKLTKGWKLLNPSAAKEDHQWAYYKNDLTQITSGWGRSITDLSGNKLQDYYFENGLAIKGWKQIDGNWYYFSEIDADNNGYIDFNKVYGGTMTIGNKTSTFDSDGVCTNNCGP